MIVHDIPRLHTVYSLIDRAEVAPVPLIAGATRDDLGYPLWPTDGLRIDCSPDKCTEVDFARFLAQAAPAFDWTEEDQLEIFEAYRGEVQLKGGNYTKWYWAAVHMGSDYAMICPARRSVRSIATAFNRTKAAALYLFSHVPDGPSGRYPKLAHHSSEIPFMFHDDTAAGPEADKFHIAKRERSIADLMAGSWATFAASGDLPHFWPQFEPTQAWLDIGDSKPVIRPQLKQQQCDLWDRIWTSRQSPATMRTAAARALNREQSMGSRHI